MSLNICISEIILKTEKANERNASVQKAFLGFKKLKDVSNICGMWKIEKKFTNDRV